MYEEFHFAMTRHSFHEFIFIFTIHHLTSLAFPASSVLRTQAQHEEAIRGILEQLQRVPIEEEMSALRFRMGMAEADNASLHGKIKTIEAIETVTLVEGVITEMPVTSAEEKAQRRLEDAKKLLEVVKKIFDRNAATKKTQKNVLKQQYKNFTAPSSEMLDQTFDRL
nr:hypothetical protein [Tanacetum cinerariifolium]